MFCDVKVPGGEPYEGDPRWIMRRALQRAADMGFDDYNIGPELEYFYFKDARPEGGKPEILDEGGYFDLTTLDAGSDVRRETILALEQLGIHVEYAHHEVGPSQHEVDMRYKDALAMSDDCMTYRIVVKEYAMKYGWHATFMPKPLFGENGSGMHVHQSLSKDGTQRLLRRRRPVLPLADGQGVHRRPAASTRARSRRCSRSGSTPTSGWCPGYEAPVYLAWSRRNRSALIRVPLYHPGKEGATRAELRCPDPACNPYLCFAGMLHAGSRGDREGLRAARADGAEPLPPDPGGAPAARHRAAARDPGRGDRGRGGVRAGAAHARRAHLQALHRDQAPGVGGLPRAGHPVGDRALPAGAVAAALLCALLFAAEPASAAKIKADAIEDAALNQADPDPHIPQRPAATSTARMARVRSRAAQAGTRTDKIPASRVSTVPGSLGSTVTGDDHGWYADGASTAIDRSLLIRVLCIPAGLLASADVREKTAPFVGDETATASAKCKGGDQVLAGGAFIHPPEAGPDPDYADLCASHRLLPDREGLDVRDQGLHSRSVRDGADDLRAMHPGAARSPTSI